MKNIMRIFTKDKPTRLLRLKNSLAMTLKNKSAFTLVEILCAIFILSIGMTSAVACILSSITFTQLARDTTTATSHAEIVLEVMRNISTLEDITSGLFVDWTTFMPTLMTFDPEIIPLKDEVVTVFFEDPTADPLRITVTISWTTKSIPKTISILTEMTKW